MLNIRKYQFFLLFFSNFLLCNCHINQHVSNQGLASHTHMAYVSIHGNLDCLVNKTHHHLKVKIHIARGQQIWFNVTTNFGIVVMRGRIKNDKIELINYMEKSYYNNNFERFNKQFKIPCTYQIIEQALLYDLPPEDFCGSPMYDALHICIHKITDSLETNLLFNRKTKRRQNFTVSDPSSLTNRWHLSYDYGDTNKKRNSYCHIKAYFRNFEFDLVFNNVQRSKQPWATPFKIPAKYVQE